jgi:aminopeptidase-like protein
MKYSTEIHNLIKKLFPIHRSLTGDGVRETLREISALIPIENKSFKSGIKAYDWVVPQEWKFKSGQIKSIDGAVVLDCKLNNCFIYPVRTKGYLIGQVTITETGDSVSRRSLLINSLSPFIKLL